MALGTSLPLWALVAAALVQFGCSDVGYNPYISNDGRRPIGKTIEAVPDAANNAVDSFDARFENAFH